MAIFNPFLPSFVENPYPAYAALRSADPVHFSPTLQAWVLTRYADCERVLRDHATFSSNPYLATSQVAQALQQQRREFPLGEVPTVLNSDPPAHTRLRGIINRAFTPRTVEARRAHIEAITRELLDAAPASEPFDLMAALAEPLPVVVIAELLGVPPSDRALFRRWSTAIAAMTNLFSTPATVDAAKRASAELVDYLGRFADERRRQPREDLITALVQAEEAGSRLTREELLAFTILLLIAGHETTTSLIGNGTLALLRRPDQWALLRDDPALVPGAVEELLRYDGPAQALARVATADASVSDRTVRKGESAILMIGAANRDPERFADPDRLDVQRADNRHLAFGIGAHFCLGAPLARLEATIAFTELVRAFPTLRLDGEPVRRGTFVLRGLETLPVARA